MFVDVAELAELFKRTLPPFWAQINRRHYWHVLRAGNDCWLYAPPGTGVGTIDAAELQSRNGSM